MLWLATHGGGLVRLDPRSGDIESFRHSALRPNGLSHDVIFSLAIDRTGLLWIGTMGGGISVWNPRDAAGYSPSCATAGRLTWSP